MNIQLKYRILSFFLLAGAIVHAQQVSDVIDVIHYDFKIELTDVNDEIAGRAAITFSFRKEAKGFELDLIGKAGDKGMTVTSVSGAREKFVFTHRANKVSVMFPTTYPAGSQHTIYIEYNGTPADGLIISKNKYGDRTFFADNWPSRGRNWLPLIDHPGDKATVDFTVIAPMHYDVVANGVKKEETYLDESRKLTRYEEDTEIASKVMVIGVARFATQRLGSIQHVPVEAWVYPQDRDAGFHDYKLAVDALEFFIDRVGPYPYDKLANVQSKTTFGGLENANTIFYSENSVTGTRSSEGLIAHEVAHQWFGNYATEKDWPHLWLSEGFATYMAHLYNEFKNGVESRRAAMRDDRNQVIAYAKRSKAPVVNTSEDDPMNLLNENTYQKGGWVLHMLRVEVGDDLFMEGIREYYRSFGGRHATTDDFRHTMERVTGKDLGVFFQQWLYRPGIPVLQTSHRFDPSKGTLELTVKQVQGGPPFVFPLEVGIDASGGQPRVEKVVIDKAEAVFSFKMDSSPKAVVLDPNVNLLFEAK